MHNGPPSVFRANRPAFASENELDGRHLIDLLTALIGAYTIPGMDVRTTLERSRRDIDALAVANRQVLHGVQRVVAGEAELLRRSVTQAIAAIENLSAAESTIDLRERQAALMVEVLEATLATMQEVAGAIASAHAEALETLRRRLSERERY